MLNSALLISLILCPELKAMQPSHHIQLTTASGQKLQANRHVQAVIQLGETKFVHNRVVTEKLVAPVILGVDFLHDQGLVLDFTTSPVTICQDQWC